ncbi:IST1 homolog [Mixophyes fleayi]|uniref:IST1 homolog n=1 Tax=Mixophyes fleayi TaxID=3061075 RepID=UPI003F4E3FBF
MFGSSFKVHRLSSSLKDAIKQLQELKKYKSEAAENVKKEISEHLNSKKIARAQIRAEHIIREDNLVEAMEMIEMYCDVLYKKTGLIQSKTDLDPALSEAVSTVIWASPHMETEVSELKTVASQLCLKYSKEYGSLCRSNKLGTVNEKVIQKLSTQAPPKYLVEKYLVDIAKQFHIEYNPADIMVDTSPRLEDFAFGSSVGSPKQDNPNCPYPQNKVSFPDAEEIIRALDSGSPRDAGIGLFPHLYESPGSSSLKSDNLDPSPTLDFGFKPDLWTDNQEAEIKNKQGGEDIDQLANRLKELKETLS